MAISTRARFLGVAMAVCLVLGTGCNDSNTVTGPAATPTPAPATATPAPATATPTRVVPTSTPPSPAPSTPTPTPAPPTSTPAPLAQTPSRTPTPLLWPWPGPTPPTPGPYTLSGTVRYANSGHGPIPHASVEIQSGPQLGKRTYSDLIGRYELSGLFPGTISVRAQVSHSEDTKTVTVTSDSTLDFDIWFYY